MNVSQTSFLWRRPVTGGGICQVSTTLYQARTEPLRDLVRETQVELRGTTFDSYHDAFGEGGKFQHQVKVFARPGEPCPVCSTEIQKLRVAGRGTHVCPLCQPL